MICILTTKENQLVVLGETNFRSQRWRFGIKQDDRRRHMYVVGSTGMGKTEFLKNMAIQDIEAGRGLAYIDPHGDAADYFLDFIPVERVKDVIYLDPGDLNFPIAFNVMEKVDFEYRHLVASGLLGVFKKLFGVEVWSGRMEYILNNTILALLEYPDSTLLAITKMFSNKEYRKKVVDNVKDPIVKSFWNDEFAKYTERFAAEATPAIQNKIGQFTSNNLIRNIIGQTHSTIDIRRIMDEGKILIVNLSRGKIGEDASRLLGALLITKIQLAAMSRVDIPENDRRDFHLYVDEFQHFATESFANILSEARKFHLSLIVAHQYIKQMDEKVADAVFGNVGTIISFRVGADDAEFLEKWFQPDFAMTDIVNLGKYNIYLKLMIDGVSSKGFSAQTLPPLPKLEVSNRDAVIEYTRKHYATPREIVDKNIADWAGTSYAPEPPAPKSGSSYGERPRDNYQSARPNQYAPRQDFRDNRQQDNRYQDNRYQENRSQEPARPRSVPITSEKIEEPHAIEQAPTVNIVKESAPIKAPVAPSASVTPSATPAPTASVSKPRESTPTVQPYSRPPIQPQAPQMQHRPVEHRPQRFDNRPQNRPMDNRQPDFRRQDQSRPQRQGDFRDQRPQNPSFRNESHNPAHRNPAHFNPEPKDQIPYGPKPAEGSEPATIFPKPSSGGGLSLKDALVQSPVNFKGKRIEEKKERPKIEVDTDGLKKILEEAMKPKE